MVLNPSLDATGAQSSSESLAMSLRSRNLQFQNLDVSFPSEHIVQVTLNRPEKLNCIDKATSQQIQSIWEQFDQDENLCVGIITGSGRAFCTGADLQGKSATACYDALSST